MPSMEPQGAPIVTGFQQDPVPLVRILWDLQSSQFSTHLILHSVENMNKYIKHNENGLTFLKLQTPAFCSRQFTEFICVDYDGEWSGF